MPASEAPAPDRPADCQPPRDDPEPCFRRCFDACVRLKGQKRLRRRTERFCKGTVPEYAVCMLERGSDRQCRSLDEMRQCEARLAELPAWTRRMAGELAEDLCPEGACKARCAAGRRSREACEAIRGCGWTLASSDFGDETAQPCVYQGSDVGGLYAKCSRHCGGLRASPPLALGAACSTYDTACCYEPDRPKASSGRCSTGLRCVRDPDSENPDRTKGVCRCAAHPQETSYCCPELHRDQPVPEDVSF